MSTRTSIFREYEPGVYYGVYRHHDGYPEGAGQDLMDAIEEGRLEDHMSDLLERYGTEYENYAFNNIMDLWGNSDHEYGYVVHLDGRTDVYEIYFGPMLENNKIIYIGELKEVLEQCG